MQTACFWVGVLTETPYTVFGYKGGWVHDSVHSDDLIRAFDALHSMPFTGTARR